MGAMSSYFGANSAQFTINIWIKKRKTKEGGKDKNNSRRNGSKIDSLLDDTQITLQAR